MEHVLLQMFSHSIIGAFFVIVRIDSIAPISQVRKLRHSDVNTIFVGLGCTSATLGEL